MELELEVKGIKDGIDNFKADAKKSIEDAKLEAKAAKDEAASLKEANIKIGQDFAELGKRFDEAELARKAADKFLQAQKGKKTFTEAFADLVENNYKEISQVRKGAGLKIPMDLKTVGNMTLSANLTGDSVINYNDRNAILPSTKVNFRDLLPTNPSSTLVQAYYRETGQEGGVNVQTEGVAKPQVDYDFTEIKTVNKYIAGYIRFSKQMQKALPWMQSTLPRLLLREFYSGATGENALFFATVNGAATGSTTTSETDDIKQIIDYISNQRTAKFNASYGLVSHKQLARLNKLTYTNGYYTGSGGVLTRVDGSMAISGVPIIPVDWVTDDKILIFDADYLERVEAESLMIEFFEQDSDNVQKNLITARIECLEEINLMLPTSAIYADLGNLT